ncbi:PIN domain-containing protein [Nitrosococcus oceani]|uniref:PilT-like protein n=2 Tax=Nitrosococcus oceani TaxID=1229 RepID=Q3JB47_NITOC|nr:PIN domain-containing protein [Nitrosococcus oceani]KFI19677.1 twitching motility protein PilT [Nitrosococcus oceani C-27]ABA57949.1 PilT-like protein [Nitrosococcus oceani ATCC 19707]EDZ68227.1 hypothetical protein NOC27_1554 [Nitrosococcus oceani AFC27]KFI22541.1 twitching motility protein PilT [Nitrosococcus oceani]GEM19592.1 PIN domain nuclease [Nitrosococcus oceani]
MSASFLDTNVLVYLFDEENQRKSDIAQERVSQALRTGESIISFQVVQETLNVITKKLLVPVTPEQADTFLTGTLVPLWKVNPSRELYRRGLNIQSRYQYSFYDSLIIAAALEAGCKTLYSEDLQQGQRIEQLTIKNPFME